MQVEKKPQVYVVFPEPSVKNFAIQIMHLQSKQN